MDTTVIGAVLAGGSSSRFGSDKASTIGHSVIAAMRTAGLDPVVAVGGSPNQRLGIPIVDDIIANQGPLVAVTSVLLWAKRGQVLISPCDLPLLTHQTIEKLLSAVETAPSDWATIAATKDDLCYYLGCYPAQWALKAKQLVDAGERRLSSLLGLGHWQTVLLDPSVLTDADYRSDFDRLITRRKL